MAPERRERFRAQTRREMSEQHEVFLEIKDKLIISEGDSSWSGALQYGRWNVCRSSKRKYFSWRQMCLPCTSGNEESEREKFTQDPDDMFCKHESAGGEVKLLVREDIQEIKKIVVKMYAKQFFEIFILQWGGTVCCILSGEKSTLHTFQSKSL